MSVPGSIASRITLSGYFHAACRSDNQDVRSLLARAREASLAMPIGRTRRLGRRVRSPARSSGRLGLRFTELAILLVSFALAAAGTSTLVTLQRSADEARQAELLVARVGESATNLNEQTTLAVDQGLDRRVRARVKQHRASLERTLAALQALDGDDRYVRVLSRRRSRLRSLVDRTLALVAEGKRARARVHQRRRVAPAFRALQTAVDAAGRHYDSRATEAARTSVVGSALAVSAAVLLVGLLAVALSRRRATREQTAFHARTAVVRLLQAVSATSNAAATLDEAFLAVLAEVCRHSRWQVGHVYLRAADASGDLVSTGLWHVDGPRERFAALVHESGERRFGPGDGLPGQVVRQRRPVWVAEIGGAARLTPHVAAAQRVGLRSAFAFPVIVRAEVVAVLEFFSLDERAPDDSLIEATAHVGIQLGYLIERKRAEGELRATEARYRILVEQLPLATYIDGPEGLESSTYISPQVLEMSGYGPAEWLADKKLFQKMLHPDDRERVVDTIRSATARAAPVEQEYRIVGKDGSIHWWHDAAVVVRDEKGRPAYRQGYAVDITARKESEERLREAEQRYRTLVEQLPLATYIDALDETSSAIYMSPQIEPMLGYTTEEWTGDKALFPKLLHPEDRERVMAEVARTQTTGEPFRCEYRLLARDGRVVWIRDEDVTIRDSEGRKLYAQGYMLDITNRKETEEILERALERERAANEHLRELDRLKDEFIALVSHELRTPLTSIRGYLEFLLEDAERLAPEHARFLGVVDRNAERLQHLVNDLLFVAQVDAGRLTIQQAEVDLAELAAEAVEAARVVASAKEIELDLDAEPIESLVGDRARLAQLLDNFISNAIKFTPEGGRVTVRAWAEGEHGLVSIADSGIGIPEDEQARLFERFYRASSATEQAIPGTGLGLAIAKAIVDAHGGTIRVESVVGRGTTFTVALPLAAEGAVEQAA
jgi:PAS domain S-box-containing protein